MNQLHSKQLDGLGIAVTGAAGDLGHAMSLELARRGAHVTMIDMADEQDAAARIGAVADAGQGTYIQADVTNRDAVQAALAAIDPLDVAIGNAGIVESAPFLEVTPEQWQAHLDVNLGGGFNVGQIAARLLAGRDRPGLIPRIQCLRVAAGWAGG